MKVFQGVILIWACLGALFGGVNGASAAGDPPFEKPDFPPEDFLPGFPSNRPELDLEAFLLPDLQTLPPYDLQLLVRGSGKRVLRFSNSVWNRGLGALEVHGTFDRQNNQVEVSQVLFGPGGNAELRQIGNFVFHPVHAHWHWEGFSVYEIWSVRVDGKLGKILATSGKVGYCMVDTRPAGTELIEDLDETTIPARPQYGACYWRKQGLSVGWVDTYKRHLDGQSLDVTNVPDGLYALRSTVNPQGFIIETDSSNNSAVVYFRLHGDKLEMVETVLNEGIFPNRNR